MGLFNKIKNMFAKKDVSVEEEHIEIDKNEDVEEESVEIAEESVNVVEDVSSKNSEEEIVDAVYEEIEEEDYEDNEIEEVSGETFEEVEIYEKGLTKSRESFVSKLVNLTNRYKKITDDYFDELEEVLIMADIGVNTVMDFIDRLKKRVYEEKITDTELLNELIVDELFIIYVDDSVLSTKINYQEEGPTVILMVGVNGVGKTTTIGKLAAKEKDMGKKVLLVGADTFRAGATEQLNEWAKRIGVDYYGGSENADPASVTFDGVKKANEENYDVVFVDTAGRLQNKVNLMKELEKINSVMSRIVDNAPHETLLVIDATTGQNGISQAKSFKDITGVTGIVLTKLDGTAKGGIVLAIKEEVDIPVKFIGFGESKNDLQVFDVEKYIYGLFKEMM